MGWPRAAPADPRRFDSPPSWVACAIQLWRLPYRVHTLQSFVGLGLGQRRRCALLQQAVEGGRGSILTHEGVHLCQAAPGGHAWSTTALRTSRTDLLFEKLRKGLHLHKLGEEGEVRLGVIAEKGQLVEEGVVPTCGAQYSDGTPPEPGGSSGWGGGPAKRSSGSSGMTMYVS